MYLKLSIRNMKRNIKDYILYYMTITLVVAMFYLFLALADSEQILELSDNLSEFSKIVMFLSLLITIIAAFIVRYVMRFMLKQRKKEFAIYMLSGIKRRAIMWMFTIENSLAGTMALISGIIVGIIFLNPLCSWVQNIFDSKQIYKITFSINAAQCTAILLCMMYGMGFLCSANELYQQNLLELLYNKQKSSELDKSIASNRRRNIIILTIILMGITIFAKGLNESSNTAILFLITSFGLIIIGNFFLSEQLLLCLTAFKYVYNTWIYKGINIYLYKHMLLIGNEKRKIIGILATLIMVLLGTMSLGLSVGAVYKSNLKSYYPYDVAIALDAKIPLENFEGVLQIVEREVQIKDTVSYYLYENDALPGIGILCLSDYNRLREQLGLSPKSLKENEYLVHCEEWTDLEALKKKIEGKPLVLIKNRQYIHASDFLFKEPMEQMWMAGINGQAVVIPDSAKDDLDTQKSRLVITAAGSVNKNLKNELEDYLNKQWEFIIEETADKDHIFLGVIVKSWSLANSLGGYTMLSFCGLYLSIALLILLGAFIAFDQLSSVDRDKQQFQILHYIGVPQKEIFKEIAKEIGIRFFVPAVCPIVILLSVTQILNLKYGKYIISDPYIIWKYTGIAVAVFLVIYMMYFLLTYLTYKRCIKVEENNGE